ncbi:MAG TPA: hypothetical protein VIG25_18205 [Pyrinomonadaceae bacterium]|jgi:hypothetical protein
MKSFGPTQTRVPFPFVLEELMPLRPTVKRAFGFTYLYLDDILLCGLRESQNRPNSNGIWLFTTREHVDRLANEFPDLPKRYLWRSGNNAWVILPSKLAYFEDYAFKACELILNGDRRIGRVSRATVRPQ